MSAVAGPATSDGAVYGLSWPHQLFPYQIVGIDKFLHSPSVLLADEMGLGKTIPATPALRVFAFRGEARCIVICPARLVLQWRRQLRLWAPELTISTVVGTADERYAAWRRGRIRDEMRARGFRVSHNLVANTITQQAEGAA